MFKNMSLGRKMIQAMLKSDRREMERGSDLSDKTNVNEEYKEVFRTKSYVEMDKTCFDKLPSSSSSVPYSINLSAYLDKIESLKFHHLVLNHFEAGLDACNLCELILGSVHQTRVYYRKLRRVIKMSKGLKDFSDEQSSLILKELSEFAFLKNPLSVISPLQFLDIHKTNLNLFRKLTSKREKINRQAKYRRISKKIGSVCLVVSHTTLLIALTALAIHSMVGIIAAPGLLACVLGIRKKKKCKSSDQQQRRYKISSSERLGAQLDISAKGIYILINDFDTISRLFWKLHDEIEHRKTIAKMCIRNRKIEVLREVIKEYRMHDSSFLELLKELEEHTKLCFHTINRSRRLVIQEIIDAQP